MDQVLSLESSSLYALIGYTILTLIYTYPLILKISTHVIGSGGDALMHQNILWWFHEAIFELGVNPLHSNYLNYPLGLDIYFVAIIGLILIPITHIFGVTTSYNIYIFLTFILSGFGMFLLVQYLTKNKEASFVAGIAYAFTPFHFAHAMGHLHIMSIQWIPFYVLFLMKMIKDKNRLDTYLCAIFFSLTVLSSQTLGIYIVIFSILYIIHIYYTDRSIVISYDFLKKSIKFICISTILCLPFLMVLIKAMLTNPYMYKPLSEFIYYSADLLSFFVPSPYQTISGGHTHDMYLHFTGNFVEQSTYLRYTVLVLAFYVIYRAKENSMTQNLAMKTDIQRDLCSFQKNIKFFIFSGLIFFILSLGPVLNVYGEYQFTKHNITLWLPYLIMYYMPITSMARVPSRSVIMVILILAILNGYAISMILQKVKNIPKRQFIYILIAVMIFIESICFPIRFTELKVPDFYYYLGGDEDDYAIMEIPLSISEFGVLPYIHDYSLYQTVHGKKLLGPVGSREYLPFKKFIEKNPDLQRLVQFDVIYERDILYQDQYNLTNSVLNYYDVNYVIIHYNLIKKDHLNNAEFTILQIFGTDPYLEEKDMFVYKIEKDKDFIPFMILGDGWYEKEMWNGNTPTRWMKNNGTIKILSPEHYFGMLNITVTPFYKQRTLMTYMNGEMVNTSIVNGFYSFSIPLTIEKGENMLTFYIPEGTDKPSEILGTSDGRDLSMAFQQINLNVTM